MQSLDDLKVIVKSAGTCFWGWMGEGGLPDDIYPNGIVVESQGGVFKVSAVGSAPVGGGRRGKVRKFSKGSRKRLIERLRRIDAKAYDPKGTAFVTLTVPANSEKWTCPDMEGFKAAWNEFGKRILRDFPKAAVLWVLEFQERGAPHFHCIMFNVKGLSSLVIREWWRVALKIPQDVFMILPHVERPRDLHRLMCYMAKYLSKAEKGCEISESEWARSGGWVSGDGAADAALGAGAARSALDHGTYLGMMGSPGRFWGIIGRKNLIMAELVQGWMPGGKWFLKFRRVARNYVIKRLGHSLPPFGGADGVPRCGFTLFIDHSDDVHVQWWRCLTSLGPPGGLELVPF